jgi:hypothetical protein
MSTKPLPFTGITKIDAALTDAWQQRLTIRIKTRQVEPLFEGDPPWTSWQVRIGRPNKAPGSMLEVYDQGSYVLLHWHTRGRHTRFSGGTCEAFGRRGWEVDSYRRLYQAIDRVAIGI